jgi:hypothetical protein
MCLTHPPFSKAQVQAIFSCMPDITAHLGSIWAAPACEGKAAIARPKAKRRARMTIVPPMAGSGGAPAAIFGFNPWVDPIIAAISLILLALPTGLEPVFSP